MLHQPGGDAATLSADQCFGETLSWKSRTAGSKSTGEVCLGRLRGVWSKVESRTSRRRTPVWVLLSWGFSERYGTERYGPMLRLMLMVVAPVTSTPSKGRRRGLYRSSSWCSCESRWCLDPRTSTVHADAAPSWCYVPAYRSDQCVPVRCRDAPLYDRDVLLEGVVRRGSRWSRSVWRRLLLNLHLVGHDPPRSSSSRGGLVGDSTLTWKLQRSRRTRTSTSTLERPASPLYMVFLCRRRARCRRGVRAGRGSRRRSCPCRGTARSRSDEISTVPMAGRSRS